ncbi:MAG: hypothetical protein HQK52_09180 [Oligoflexia bacterium]|nr:hypothetical protein [Oligoflexia bacterium]
MKFLLFLLLFFFSSLPPSSAATAAEDDDHDALLEMIMLLNEGLMLGIADGRSYFDHFFIDDCTFLTINSSAVQTFFHTAVHFRVPPGDYYVAGYKSGWLVGYIQRFHAVSDKCEQQLSENMRRALGERVKYCQEYVLPILKEVSLAEAIRNLPPSGLSSLRKEQLFAMVEFGQKKEAWEALLQEEHQFFSKLPCQIAAVDAVIDYLKRTTNGAN